jgi:hypothetical protein
MRVLFTDRVKNQSSFYVDRPALFKNNKHPRLREAACLQKLLFTKQLPFR